MLPEAQSVLWTCLGPGQQLICCHVHMDTAGGTNTCMPLCEHRRTGYCCYNVEAQGADMLPNPRRRCGRPKASTSPYPSWSRQSPRWQEKRHTCPSGSPASRLCCVTPWGGIARCARHENDANALEAAQLYGASVSTHTRAWGQEFGLHVCA